MASAHASTLREKASVRRSPGHSLLASALVDVVVQYEAHELVRERRDAVATVVAHGRVLLGGVVCDSLPDSEPGRHTIRSLCAPGCQRVVETSTISPECVYSRARRPGSLIRISLRRALQPHFGWQNGPVEGPLPEV